jgi:hypothetical protein
LELKVSEAAVVKRNPSLKAFAVEWDDEEQIDLPTTDVNRAFKGAAQALAERFALAYLAANKGN